MAVLMPPGPIPISSENAAVGMAKRAPIVTKLDRLARSTQHLLEIADRVKSKGAVLHILNLGADTGTATGKLMFTVIGAIATFEREMMLERQREGIAKAKAEGKYRGRKATARARATEIILDYLVTNYGSGN